MPDSTVTANPDDDAALELTILMPCLDEAETLEICITKALDCLKEMGVQGEVLISDNGSTDGSIEIAKRCGARVRERSIARIRWCYSGRDR